MRREKLSQEEHLINTLKQQIAALDPQTKATLKDSLYRISRNTNARVSSTGRSKAALEGSRRKLGHCLDLYNSDPCDPILRQTSWVTPKALQNCPFSPLLLCISRNPTRFNHGCLQGFPSYFLMHMAGFRSSGSGPVEAFEPRAITFTSL